MSLSPHLQEAYDQVIGNLPKITMLPNYTKGCLYQAFVGSISVFEALKIPDSYLAKSFASLSERVQISRQPKAQECFDAFKKRYAEQIS